MLLLLPALLFPFLTTTATSAPTLVTPGATTAGSLMPVTGSGFAHGALVRLGWDGSRTPMPTVRVDAHGNLSTTVLVPANAALGDHVLSASGVAWVWNTVPSSAMALAARGPALLASVHVRVNPRTGSAPGPTPTAAPTSAPTTAPTAAPTSAPAPPTPTVAPTSAPTSAPATCPRSVQAAINAAPAGSTVELSGCGPYSEPVSISKPLTVVGLVDRNVAAQAQRGFVELAGGGITIRGAQLSGATSGACLGIEGGSGYRIDASSFVGCAQEGIAIHGDFSGFGRVHGVTITNSTISGANAAHAYSAGNEAGGIKFVSADDVTISGSTVSGNGGPGIWCDGAGVTALLSGNRVAGNDRAGIMIETCTGAQVTANAVWEDGWANPDAAAWAGWGGGILVSSSAGVVVSDNTIAWCPAGLGVISQVRPDAPGTVAGDTGTANRLALSSGRPLVALYAEPGAPANWGAFSPNATASPAQLAAAGIPTAPQAGH